MRFGYHAFCKCRILPDEQNRIKNKKYVPTDRSLAPRDGAAFFVVVVFRTNLIAQFVRRIQHAFQLDVNISEPRMVIIELDSGKNSNRFTSAMSERAKHGHRKWDSRLCGLDLYDVHAMKWNQRRRCFRWTLRFASKSNVIQQWRLRVSRPLISESFSVQKYSRIRMRSNVKEETHECNQSIASLWQRSSSRISTVRH